MHYIEELYLISTALSGILAGDLSELPELQILTGLEYFHLNGVRSDTDGECCCWILASILRLNSPVLKQITITFSDTRLLDRLMQDGKLFSRLASMLLEARFQGLRLVKIQHLWNVETEEYSMRLQEWMQEIIARGVDVVFTCDIDDESERVSPPRTSISSGL